MKSENKLGIMGYVEFVEYLSNGQKLKIEKSEVKNFIPWEAVWNTNSLIKPC